MRHAGNGARKLISLLLLCTSVAAHSWLDCVNFDFANDTCLGYPRSYPGRENRDINTIYTYLIDGNPQERPMCDPRRQSRPFYTQKFPMAVAHPGDRLNMVWEMNGHLNDNKPTYVSIYWISNDEDHNQQQPDRNVVPTIGERIVFATSSNCDEPSNPNSRCHGSFRLPANMRSGVHSFVWFWQFDKNPAGEQYTTCFDVHIMPSGQSQQLESNS
ncbi:hypothetical protein GQ42DRAFT_128434, partial [Ramicandelaber brevisporus]